MKNKTFFFTPAAQSLLSELLNDANLSVRGKADVHISRRVESKI
jgi:hypothetical protein